MSLTAVQATEHQKEVAIEEVELIEGEAEADTRNKQDFGSRSPKKQKMGKSSVGTTQGLLRKVVLPF